MHEGDAQHIAVVRVVYVAVVFGEPAEPGGVFCRGELGVLLHIAVKLRLGREVAEVVHRLAHEAAAVLRVRGHLGHDEVRLAQRRALGVDADEYLRDLVYVERMRKLNNAYLPVGNAFKFVYRTVYLVRRNAFILFTVLDGKVEGVEIRLEKDGNVGNPALVFQV